MDKDKYERDVLIDKLKEEYPIEEQVQFNEFNVTDKLQENMKLRLKYEELYKQEKFIYDSILEKYDILVGQRYDFYRFESDRNLTKTEIEQYYLPKDAKILKFKKLLKKQEIRVKFFELCYKAINDLYWRIKNYIDHERI